MYNIFAANLPLDAEEPALENWFSQKGFLLKSLDLVRDRLSGHSRGFAFLEVDEDQVARCTLRCNGQAFSGRKLVVNRVSSPGGPTRLHLNKLALPNVIGK